MKKIVLIVGSVDQRTTSGFIKEFESLGGEIDHFIFLFAKRDWKFFLKKRLRGLKNLRMAELKQALVQIVALVYGKRLMSEVFDAWNNQGENSWNLLSKGMNIEDYANEKNISYTHSLGLNKSTANKHLSSEGTLFIMYSGGFISEELLDLEKAEFINAHMGEMPTYRGMNVIEWAVLENKQPKVSVMIMNKAVDGGDVIYEKNIDIVGSRTIIDLRRRGYECCYKAMAEGVFAYRTSPEIRKKQSTGAKYYYRMHTALRNTVENKLNSN